MSYLELSEFRNTPKPTDEDLLQKWNEMKEQYELNLFRMKRDELLKESDIYVLNDYPHKTPEIKKAWIIYRLALKDATIDKILPEKPL